VHARSSSRSAVQLGPQPPTTTDSTASSGLSVYQLVESNSTNKFSQRVAADRSWAKLSDERMTRHLLLGLKAGNLMMVRSSYDG
jgi:hypothetical protein